MKRYDEINITELADLFPSNQSKPVVQQVRCISPRFWKPGMTYEQALAAQEENAERIREKCRQRGLPY
jgi:hypothetical protein